MNLKSVVTNVVLRVVLNLKNKNFAVYKDNSEVLTNVMFIDGSIDDDASLMTHPLENGAVITDHMVFNPHKGSLSLLVEDEDQSSLSEISEYFHNGTLLTIKAKGEIFPNMVISAKPFKVNSNYFNMTQYSLSFCEVQLADTQYLKLTEEQVKEMKNTSTSKIGQKTAVKQL